MFCITVLKICLRAIWNVYSCGRNSRTGEPFIIFTSTQCNLRTAAGLSGLERISLWCNAVFMIHLRNLKYPLISLSFIIIHIVKKIAFKYPSFIRKFESWARKYSCWLRNYHWVQVSLTMKMILCISHVVCQQFSNYVKSGNLISNSKWTSFTGHQCWLAAWRNDKI